MINPLPREALQKIERALIALRILRILHEIHIALIGAAWKRRVDGNWHIEIERRSIELVVLRRGRALAARKGMEPDGFEALFFAALHFGDVFFCADLRHEGNADQAIGIDRAILLDKVIVERADNCQKSFFISFFLVYGAAFAASKQTRPAQRP